MKIMKKNKGISLIVLVITIIVIIILAGTVILSLTQNNPISKAKEAVFKSDVANFKIELETYNITQIAQKLGGYEKSKLNSDKDMLEYAKIIEPNKTMIDIIPSMKQKLGYTEKFIVSEGILVYIGTNPEEIKWSDDLGIPNTSKPPVVITELPNPAEVKSGNEVKYMIRFSSSNKLVDFKSENIELLTKDKQNTENNITVGELSGTDTEKTVEVIVDTTNLESGEYVLLVKSGTIKDEITNLFNKEVYSESFIVDNTAPGVPEILVQPTTPTNSNVTVTINYSEDSTLKQYKIGTGTWQDYTVPFTIEENVDIIARARNKLSTETMGEVLAIRNIDKTNPNAANIVVSSSNDKITGSITLTDNTGGSGIDYTNSKYIINTTSTTYGINDSIWSSATILTTSPVQINETKTDGTYYLHVLVVDKAGNKIVSKSSSIIVLNNGITDGGWNESKGVNSPVLKTGMTPIKWNGSTWIDTIASDTEWYNYQNKEWANARTADGSFWVWIPRYEYKIPNPNTSTAQTILINFKQDISTTTTSGYILHPAFTFGTTALKGIWIAKFEATAREGVSNTYIGDNVTTKNVKIQPLAKTWRTISISNIHNVARKMETDATYGWGTSGEGIDTHMMKNIEWGASAYLSHSAYGKNEKIWINPNSNYITGQAGNSVNASSTSSTNSYDTANGMQASTTGNITGIYDMCGGTLEYIAGYVNNGVEALTKNGLDLINADNKYKDIYVVGTRDAYQANYEANADKKGDAVYETSSNGDSSNTSWYNTESSMANATFPFFRRGGAYSSGNKAGIFNFYGFAGSYSEYCGFRVALAVSNLI